MELFLGIALILVATVDILFKPGHANSDERRTTH